MFRRARSIRLSSHRLSCRLQGVPAHKTSSGNSERRNAALKFIHRLIVAIDCPTRQSARKNCLHVVSHIDASLSSLRRSHARPSTFTTGNTTLIFRFWRLKIDYRPARCGNALVAGRQSMVAKGRGNFGRRVKSLLRFGTGGRGVQALRFKLMLRDLVSMFKGVKALLYADIWVAQTCGSRISGHISIKIRPKCTSQLTW
jgi:hypothetical protein